MPQNKQKLICNTLTMVVATVAIVLLGFSSSYSSVAALSLQSVIHHHHSNVFDKKQQDSASSGGDGRSSSNTKSSDNSNNDGSSDGINNNNKNQGTNDDSSNSGAHDNLQSVEPAKTGKEGELGSGENVASPTGTTAPTPESQTSCEQGSNCTNQQGLGDHDRSSTTGSAGKSGQDNNTPFILPFP